MKAALSPRAPARLQAGARAAALFAAAIGALVLAGWLLKIRALMQVFPGLVAMAPNAAVGFLLFGLSLWLLAGRQSERLLWLSRIAAAAGGLLGLLTLAEYVSGTNLGIDELLFRDTMGLTGAFPCRMAEAAAICFVILASALVLASLRRLQPIVDSLAVITGVLLVHAGPVSRLIISDTVGGMLARRILPVALGVPFVLGWLRLVGQRAGLYDANFGTALYAVTMAFVLLATLWGIANALMRSEEALQKAQERLLLSQQAAGIGPFSWDIQNDVNEWSDELMALYGLPPGGFGGKYESWRECVFADDLAEAEAAIERSLTGGEFFQDFRVVWPDGSVRWLHAQAKVFFSEDGKPLRMVGVNMDITDRKRAEEEIHRLNAELEQRVVERTAQLEAANKELDAFAYSVAHDLRAPLRAIGGFSQLLEEDYGEKLDAEGHRAIARIVAGARAMGQLIDDLLKLSRVSRGELRRERVDLSEVAWDVAAGHRRLEPDRKVEVVIAPGAVVEGDPELLRVAMENLLGNAFKFTAKRTGARIEFGVERNGEAPAFFVRDNGAGFDPAYAGKLFGAFQRLHTEAEFPGTGIGLATVQRILHRHGGRTWAEGQVDQGATFHFTLQKE